MDGKRLAALWLVVYFGWFCAGTLLGVMLSAWYLR